MTIINQELQQIISRPGPPRDRLQQVLRDIFQARVDDNGFLQITPRLRQLKLSPVDPFFAAFRQLVIREYRTNAGLRQDELGHHLHLFRSYLDLFYLNAIRAFPGVSDYQKLLASTRTYRLRLDYQTSSRYHTRCPGQFDYPRNMKVQLLRNSWRLTRNPARMIELIVNIDTGAFVSEWDQYRVGPTNQVISAPTAYAPAQLAAIANTESFNYGVPHGQYFVYPWLRKTHQRLDVHQPADSLIRRRAKRAYPAPPASRFVDVVRGANDVAVWQSLSPEDRQRLYPEFVDWQHASHGPNRGIANFLKYHY